MNEERERQRERKRERERVRRSPMDHGEFVEEASQGRESWPLEREFGREGKKSECYPARDVSV